MMEIFALIFACIGDALAWTALTTSWRVYLMLIAVMLLGLLGVITFGGIPFFVLLGAALVFGIKWERRSEAQRLKFL